MKNLVFDDKYKNDVFEDGMPRLDMDGIIKCIEDFGDMPDRMVFTFDDYLNLVQWDMVVNYDVKTKSAYLFGIIELAYKK